MRRALFLGALLALGPSCGGTGARDPNFETTLEVLDAGGTPTSTFTVGQPITFRMSVRNRTSTPQSVALPTAQQQEFLVLDGVPQIVWSWGGVSPPVVSDVDFTGSETKVFTATWTQVDENGVQVPAGVYDAQGHLATTEENTKNTAKDFTPTATRSAKVVFTIQ